MGIGTAGSRAVEGAGGDVVETTYTHVQEYILVFSRTGAIKCYLILNKGGYLQFSSLRFQFYTCIRSCLQITSLS